MSDSTPKPTAADAPTAPEGSSAWARGAGAPRFWAASLLFHGVVLAWILCFSPVRVIDPKAAPAVSHVGAARAREVIERIREKQSESIGQNLRTLVDIGAKIAALERRARAEFAVFAAELGKDAAAKAAAEQRTIAGLQAEALAELDDAGANGTRFVRTRTNAYFDDMVGAQRLAREKQTRVLQLQEQAQAILSLGDARFAVALAAQGEASASQDRATRALIEAEATRDRARGSRERTAYENELEHYTYHVKRTRETIAGAEDTLAVAEKRLAIAEAMLARRNAAAGEVVERAISENTDEAAQAAEAALGAAARAEKDRESAQRRVDEVPKDVLDATKRLPELEAKLAELLAKPPHEPPAPTSEDAKLLELQNVARQLQLEARQAQQEAEGAAAALHGVKDEIAVGAAALAAFDKAAPAEEASTPDDIQRMNLAQIYAAAVKTEGAFAQSYRRLRALELAMVRRLPLEKAIRLTDVAKVLRPDLSAGLAMSVTSGEDVPAAREAVRAAKAEVGAMVRLGGSLLTQAQGLGRQAGATISVDDFNRRFQQWQTMEGLAAEDEGEWARDLTAMMGGEGGEGTGDGGEGSGAEGGGEGGRGLGGGGNGGGSGRGGSGGGTAGGGAPDLGNTGIAGPFGTNDGTGPGGFGMGGIPGASGADGAPEDVSGIVVPAPGRRVASRGESPNWMFVDSWYILGPFDNIGRRNIEKKFPPETVIDLNATYPGKNGVPICWEFQQSGRPNVMPLLAGYNAAQRNPALDAEANYRNNLEYIIYYAYTELWFEEACDLWVAIASDDFSKVWIEDQLVWTSGKKLKPWRLNEGLRKVRFTQGVNRILYRVENGNNRTEFSLVISFQP